MNNTERKQVEEIRECLATYQMPYPPWGRATHLKTLLATIDRQEKEIGEFQKAYLVVFNKDASASTRCPTCSGPCELVGEYFPETGTEETYYRSTSLPSKEERSNHDR